MVDVRRYGDAIGASAIAARSVLTGTAPIHSGSLPGASGEGGLLATFDAIFQQTMKPTPSVTAPLDSTAASDASAPVAEHAEPSRAADEEQESDEEEDAPQDVPVPTAGPVSVESPAPAAPEESSEESSEENSEDFDTEAAAAAAASVQKTEPPAEASEAAAVNHAADEQGDATETQSDSQLPAENRDRKAAPTRPVGDQEAPAKAVEVATAPSSTPPGTAPTVEAKVEESGKTAAETPAPVVDDTHSEAEVGDKESGTDEAVAIDEGVAEEKSAEQSPTDGRGSRRDRTSRERSGRHGATEPGEEPMGVPGSKAPEAASGDRPIDRAVGQMQPIESSEPAAPQTSGATPGTPAVNMAAAASATPPPAAAVSGAPAASAESSAPSESRFSIDGAGENRSVGGLKSGEANAGEGRVQRGSNAEQVRLVQRVARAFQRLGPTGGRVQVMLHPAELGSVRLDLRINGNRMDARMTAETDAARSLLREHLPELRQRLAESGLVVDRVEVEVDARGQQDAAAQGREGQGREGMAERRGGFASATHRSRSSENGGSSQPAQPSRARDPRAALDLMI